MLRRRPAPFSRPGRRALATAIAACFGAAALAQPVGLNAVHGGAAVTAQNALTTVTTTNGAGSNHSVLDWRGFQVPGGHQVFFQQPHALSTSINRVTGGNPSAILGTLGSNGRLVLVNPAGIAVGPGAVVDTAGFTASTLSMNTADAIAGRLRFGDGGATPGRLEVHGQVLARGGDVVLVGSQVEAGAGAIIRAVGGDVVLAAGRQVELTGRGLEGIHLQVKAPGDRAVNLGTLAGDSVGIFAGQLRHSGLIQASTATAAGGKVVLRAAQSAEVAGAIRAATQAGGGTVHVTAERVELKAAASIDTSHAHGGGAILVGGGWQGRDARIANARAVDVERGAQLRADATVAGDGGTIVVWSDDTTRLGGALSARGAGPAGAGGRAEVSGRRQLAFRGRADLGAQHGPAGELLLDPEVVTIRGGGSDDDDDGGFTLYENDLEGMDAHIRIEAARRIQVSGPFGGNELLVARDRDIRMEVTGAGAGGIDLVGMPLRTQGKGKVTLLTTGAGQDIRPDRIGTDGGAIRLTARLSDVLLEGRGLDAAPGTASPDDEEDEDDGGKLERVTIEGVQVRFTGDNAIVQKVKVKAQGTTNTGVLLVAQDGSLKVEGGLRNEGVLRVEGGELHMEKAGVLTNAAAGVMEARGKIELHDGLFANDGLLRVGGDAAVAALQVKGDFAQGAGGTVSMEVAGPDSHDTLSVDGAVQLDGRLQVRPLAYAPAASDSYGLVDGDSVAGSFGAVDAPAFTGFAPAYGARNVAFAMAGAPAPGPAPAPAPMPVPAPAPAQSSPPTQSSPPAHPSPPAQSSPPVPPSASAPSAPAPAPAPASVSGGPPARQQVAAQSVSRETQAWLLDAAWLEPEGSVAGDPLKKRLGVTASQCVVQ